VDAAAQRHRGGQQLAGFLKKTVQFGHDRPFWRRYCYRAASLRQKLGGANSRLVARNPKEQIPLPKLSI
jgi:hypothetical protein